MKYTTLSHYKLNILMCVRKPIKDRFDQNDLNERVEF